MIQKALIAGTGRKRAAENKYTNLHLRLGLLPEPGLRSGQYVPQLHALDLSLEQTVIPRQPVLSKGQILPGLNPGRTMLFLSLKPGQILPIRS